MSTAIYFWIAAKIDLFKNLVYVNISVFFVIYFSDYGFIWKNLLLIPWVITIYNFLPKASLNIEDWRIFITSKANERHKNKNI